MCKAGITVVRYIAYAVNVACQYLKDVRQFLFDQKGRVSTLNGLFIIGARLFRFFDNTFNEASIYFGRKFANSSP